MKEARTGLCGMSPQARTGPRACPIPEELGLPHGQPVSCWQQVPTDTAWGAGQGQLARFRLESWSTEYSRAAGKGVPGGCRGEAWGGEGRICLGLTCYTQVGPCLTLPQFAFLEWVPAGDSGDRGARRRLGAGLCRGPPPAGGPPATLPRAVAPVLPARAPGSLSQCSGLWDGGGPGPGRAVGTRPRRVACPTCRFFLHTFTAAKASCICFRRASLCRL